jgi:hypothetical protein
LQGFPRVLRVRSPVPGYAGAAKSRSAAAAGKRSSWSWRPRITRSHPRHGNPWRHAHTRMFCDVRASHVLMIARRDAARDPCRGDNAGLACAPCRSQGAPFDDLTEDPDGSVIIDEWRIECARLWRSRT